jgi:hypothetical protein
VGDRNAAGSARRGTPRSAPLARWRALLVRNAQLVEARPDGLNGRVDRGVGAVAGDVDRPAGEDVADPVQLLDHAQDLDEPGLFLARGGVAFERVPHRGTVALQHRRVLTEGVLGATDEIEEVVDPLGLRLGVADERGAQAPVLGAGAFGEVNQSGEGGRFDLGGHRDQRTIAASSGPYDGRSPRVP